MIAAQPIAADGVRLLAPAGWRRVAPAPAGAVDDPRTVLVAGTAGVRMRLDVSCQIASYRIPPDGAVVVVVRWRAPTSGGGRLRPGRAPLARLTRVRRPSFECFSGRGAAAQVVLGPHAYQVNVLVGDRAPPRLVAQALAVARSFRLS